MNKLYGNVLKEAKTSEQARKIQEHMLDCFDGYENLLLELQNTDDVKSLVEGGAFLVYYDDCREFLNDVYGTSPEASKKYSDDVVWNRYINLLAMEARNILRNPDGGGKNYVAR